MAVFSAALLKAHGFRQDLRIVVPDVDRSAAQQKGNRLLAMAKSFLLLCFVFACAVALPRAAQAEVGVWMQSPKPGPNPNTFNVYATAYSASAVTGWIIYVDDAVAYRSSNSSDTLSHTLTLPNSRHLVFTRA